MYINYMIHTQFLSLEESPWAVMGDDELFGAVDALSLSSSASDSDPKPAANRRGRADRRGPAQKRKRRRSFAESASDATALRAMLGKPKCHCKRSCLAQFTDDALFAQLLSFRSDWASLHKLDQDTEDAWLVCSVSF